MKQFKKQKGKFLSMLLVTLGASLVGNLLISKGAIKAGEGTIRTGEGTIRAGPRIFNTALFFGRF